MRLPTFDSLVTRSAPTLAVVGLLLGPDAAAQLRVLYSFDEDEGSYPDTDLVMDAEGHLYGMTVEGGDFGGGTVFELAPTATGWEHSVLHAFTGGADGGQPYGGVTLDDQGNLYGTAVVGGSGGVCVEDGCGVVFKLTKSGAGWTHGVIHDFTGGNDGFGPGGPVSFDAAGNLYGMTPTGGAFGIGIVFQLAPQPDGTWTESVIHAFTGGEDGGAASAGRLLVDASGTIRGVATVGGAHGAGTVFELAPAPGGTWTFTTLYAFQGQPDGVFPYGGLVSDAAGSLYGTTYYGGSKGLGVVYRLSLVNGIWTESVLHGFAGGRDGASSISGLALASNGSLFGTSSEGGAGCNCGTIFELAPQPDGSWKASVAHRFEGSPDGAYPYAGLVADPSGTLYGATVRGGADDDGTVFGFQP